MAIGKQSFVLLATTLASQLFNLCSIPVIARLASPADYGTYAVFVGITSLICVVAGLRYDGAIIAARSERQASLACGVFLYAGCIVAIFVCLIGFCMGPWISEVGGTPTLVFFTSLLCYVSSSCVYKTCTSWLIRIGKFNKIGALNLLFVVGTIASQVLIISSGMNPAKGLIVGAVLGQILVAVLASLAVPAKVLRFRISDIMPWMSTAKRFSNFPKYSLVYGFSGSIRERLVPTMLEVFAGTQAAGCFSMGQRLAAVPQVLMSSSLSAPLVSFTRMNPKSSVAKLSIFLISASFALIMPPAIFLAFNTQLVVVLLGEKWALAGPYVSILSILYIVVASTGFLDRLFEQYGKQNVALRLDLGFNVVLFASLAFAGISRSGLLLTVVFASTYAIYEVIWAYYVFTANKLPKDGLLRCIAFAFVSTITFLAIQLLNLVFSTSMQQNLIFCIIAYIAFLGCCWLLFRNDLYSCNVDRSVRSEATRSAAKDVA